MRCAWLALFISICCISPCFAALTERQLQEARLDPVPGSLLPLDAAFTDAANGTHISLREALEGKPAVLVLVDYTCRFICGATLAISAAALAKTGLRPGIDFQFAVIGIDPRDGVQAAQTMKTAQIGRYPALTRSAKFLVGDIVSIADVTNALNYRAVYDAEIDQFAHPTGAVILTSGGNVSQTIAGLALNEETLRAALKNAGSRQLSSLAQGIRLLCYNLDPVRGRYSATIRIVLMAACILTIAAILSFVGFLARRSKSGASP